MKKIILIILLITLIAAGATLLKKRKQSMTKAPLAKPMTYTVKIVEPKTRTVSQTSTFLAKLNSANSAAISAKLSGRIKTLLVRESQKVDQGELMVQIDDQEIRTNIKALQAQLLFAEKQRDYSKTQYERNLALFKVGGLAQEKLEDSEVILSRAETTAVELKQKISGLQNELDYLEIKAPFTGIVGTIFLRDGDLAVPGRPLFSLNSRSQKLTFSFTPCPNKIFPGQEVRLNHLKIGEITNLYNDATNGLAVAEIALKERLERPNGSYLTIEVVTKTASGCSVPISALLHRKSGTTIMHYEDDHFREKPVTVLAQSKEFALIDPLAGHPVAVAAEAKLSRLPTYGNVKIQTQPKTNQD
ncbi:MAG: efflux RND transporter periplasmic adaptor subunit [Pseudomonadota bacterium]|nr:efflux RND transporter periplasmic adaptor subunit [Pseudomonadota bacterium]